MQWRFRRTGPLSDERFGEAVLLLVRQGPQAFATGLVPEQIPFL